MPCETLRFGCAAGRPLNWEKGRDWLPMREEGLVDEPWVEEVVECPGERVPPRRLIEQGTPSTLESILASSVSASSGEIGARTIGDICRRSAFTYCRRRSESCSRRASETRDSGDSGAAWEGCAASAESAVPRAESLPAVVGGAPTVGSTLQAGASAGRLLRSVEKAGQG